MKTHLCTLAVLALGTSLPAADPASEAVAALGMLPEQRSGLRIAADERNPFAVKAKEIAKATAPEDTETQESKIRSIFKQLRVTGTRRDRTGRALALAGDLILRQGEEVKPVLEDQTEILIVSKIEPRQIELTFVEDKDSTQPRVIVLPVKNQVQVAQKLFAQPKGGKAGFYIAKGRATPEAAEAAAAIAAAAPTAPAATTPTTAWAGAPATAAGSPPRDARREAAALAGLSEPALAELIGTSTSLETAPAPAAGTPPAPAAGPAPTPSPAPAGATTPAPPANLPPAPAAPAPAGTQPVAAAPGGMAEPPSSMRRRTTPPVVESPATAAAAGPE